jgi:glycosyltransferase involved in cell wall biosynthesis
MRRRSQPQVSVVIPSFNRAADLRRCLDSLVAQTFEDFEVLVCDDGSTDNSAEVAAAYADRLDLRFDTAPNFGGPARPRNRGIALARSPYIAFLDSDDWWSPHKLAHSHPSLEAGADVVYHDLYIVRSQQQQAFKERLHATPPRSPMFQALLCTGISIPNSSTVVRKALLERIGGVCEDRELISVEDYDTWLALARVTERFVRLGACDGFYWAGGGNISAASPKQLLRIRALYSRHVQALAPDARRRADGFLAYRLARIAQHCGDLATARSCLEQALGHPIELRYRLKAIALLAGIMFRSRRP